MTQIPSGWYPDPDPDAPEPKGQRYWDGQQWTEHLQPAPGAGPTAPYGTAPGTPGPYASYPAGGYAATQVATATTPDGQPVSGWWRRAGAYVLDGLIINVITGIIGFPWIRDVSAAYTTFVEDVMDQAAGGGTVSPDSGALLNDVTGPLLVVSLIGLVVSFVYNVAFLRWKAATPGKLALGTRIRLRETPGPLSFGTIITRWAAQNAYKVVNQVPFIGFFGFLYFLLDHLWPLWDPQNQALHDKIARTNVVKK